MSQEQLATLNNLGIERFRILVIGNANAGKTTILEKVCHAQGRKPVYLDEKIDSELKPSASRGEHDIEHQFQYPTAHGFIFHDSRGFEAGGTVELKKVGRFIQSRAKQKELKDQLHAIWYCLPTSNDRGMTEAEMSLFESGTGNVPVIAIFTKMDALDERAFNELMLDDVSYSKAKEQAPNRAKAIFEENYYQRLEEVKHKPRYVVQLRDMHKEGTNCNELILRTSQALNRETLKLFCLSILRNNMESRIKQVINQIIIPQAQVALESRAFSEEQAKSQFCEAMCCFPHMLPSFDKLIANMDKNAVDATTESVHLYDREDLLFLLLHRERRELEERLHDRFEEFRQFRELEREFEDRFDRLRQRRFELLEREEEEELEEREEQDKHLRCCFETVLPSMPSQASYQLQAIWIGLMAVAVADLCLFASLSNSREDFRKALDFCLNAPSYPKLTSAVEQESSIPDANVVLEILRKNRQLSSCEVEP